MTDTASGQLVPTDKVFGVINGYHDRPYEVITDNVQTLYKC